MLSQHRIRVPAIVISALMLAGCSSAPTVTPSAPGGPTPAPSTGPSATPAPEPLQVAFFRELDFPPEASVGYGPVRAVRNEFVITGSDASGAALVWYGDSTATTWRLMDASTMGARILDIAGGPAGWLAVTQGDGEAAMGLWSSTDGRSWQRYPAPGFEQANGNSVRLTIGTASFTVAAQLADGRSLLYTSPDGRTWTASDQAAGLDYALVTPVGERFLAAFGGEPDGPTLTLEVSPDQRTWTPVTSLGDGPPTLLTSLQASAGGVVGIGTERDGGPVEAWFGTLSGSGASTSITWKRTTPRDGFGPQGLAAVAVSDPAALALTYDPATKAPIAWTATGSSSWAPATLPASTFGGGVPSSVAIVGSTAVTLGWQVNGVGEWVLHPWRSVDGGAWSEVDTDQFGSLPATPSGPCPPVVLHEVASYAAVPSVLRPVCFGGRTLRIRGYAADCGGCGGAAPGDNPEPAWLQHTLHIWELYLQPTAPGDQVSEGRLPVSIDPAHPIKVPPIGAYVELTGHFDDPAALTCTNWPLPPFGASFAPRSILVATCRQEFVVTGVQILAN